MTIRSLIDEYRWRGMLADATEGAEAALAGGAQSIYNGFDPTASSLHVGSLVPIMGLVHAQRAGHTPIALVGGGTGLIGDPSGKSGERVLLDRDVARENTECIRGQLEAFLDFSAAANPARIVDNFEWLGKTGVLEFLRDVGKHFPVGAMLGKESIRRRLDGETGISFTEFAYLLLQSYDFYRLFRDHGCRVQAGGRDQWGNITAGVELIRRITGERAYGVVFPLLMTSTGTKFGKTEAGTVWLDPERTSPYRFFQYWLNTADADAGRYLRLFTLLGQEEIEELEEAARDRPHLRPMQRVLAKEVTRRVHGETEASRARKASEALFGGGDLRGLRPGEIEDIFADVPSSSLAAEQLAGDGIALPVLLADVTLVPSRAAARRAIEQGGVYLNGERVSGAGFRVRSEHALHGKFVVLRRGKKSYHLVRVEN
ncbi:MAG: tyrosine--tRNA ligase [Gammaproteobacteria bacterium]|nr:tyrosine--tRNA ligase [Gammaproteobacteria bacterium]MDE2881939.1 tyrosine--tRNA ligase [Acidobacteriota bacterium]